MGKKQKRNKKIVVAMSGGVDSFVAAALLKKTNFYPESGQRTEVIGVFMKLNNFSSEPEKRARKVAKALKIPFSVLDLRKEFKKRIIDYFLKEHKKGMTPNPCVVCNKEIKFGLLLEKALKLGADFVATGHYARKTGNKLLKGKDKEKDQSYFLWQLTQRQLKHILFPVGDYTRTEVERLAKKFKLAPTLKVKKSVEICFIPTTINDFLRKYIKEKPGDIINVQGRKIGQHQGLCFYTIGQRKRIGLPGGPYYVLSKNIKKNTLTITKNEKDLLKKELSVKNVNWASGRKPKLPIKVKTKIRYRHQSIPAKIYKIPDTKYKILFGSPQRAVTPGQSAVFYKGEELLGGGVIC